MIIQWFPGHMTKAKRMMEDRIKNIDSLIYLLDSRAPMSCINPEFGNLISERPVLYVLNKSDMVEPAELKKWKDYFISKGMNVVAVNSCSNAGKDTNVVLNELYKINETKILRNKDKGVNYSIKAMVIGMPNTGKSTFINSLCKDKRATTGDKPGVTRGEQWVRLSNGIILLDTPGTLCHSIKNERTALNLAFIGCIRDAVLDTDELALELIKFLVANYKDAFLKRYNNVETEDESALGIMEQIAIKRGFYWRGGELDYSRTATAIIEDFRKQRIAKVILEKCDEKL